MKFKDVVDNLNILKLDKIADCLTEYVDCKCQYKIDKKI